MEEFKQVKWEILRDELYEIGDDCDRLRQMIVDKQIEIDQLKEQMSLVQGGQYRQAMYNHQAAGDLPHLIYEEPFEKRYKKCLVEGLSSKYAAYKATKDLKESELKNIQGHQQWYECLQEMLALLRGSAPSSSEQSPLLAQEETSLNETILLEADSSIDSPEDPYEQAMTVKPSLVALSKAGTKKNDTTQIANIRNILRENMTEQYRSKLKQIDPEISTPAKADGAGKNAATDLMFETSKRRRSRKHRDQVDRLKQLVAKSSSPGEKIKQSSTYTSFYGGTIAVHLHVVCLVNLVLFLKDKSSFQSRTAKAKKQLNITQPQRLQGIRRDLDFVPKKF